MKAKLKFRLDGQTIESGEEIPASMLEAAKMRGYVVEVRAPKPKRVEAE